MIPNSPKQWLGLLAYALVEYFMGKNKTLEPNSTVDLGIILMRKIATGISGIFKRIRGK